MMKKIVTWILVCVLTCGMLPCAMGISAAEALPNLALNKPTTAYSYQHGCYAYYATDGNINTWWTRANPGDIPWVQVDLGAAYKITSVVVAPRQDQDVAAWRVGFQVLLSNTADFSSGVATYEMGPESVGFKENITFDTATGEAFRYVRVYKPDASTITHVAELEVYSDPELLKTAGLGFDDVADGTALSEALYLMRALGFVPESDAFGADNLMTRAQAVSLITDVFYGDASLLQAGQAPVFSDVDALSKYYERIHTAYALGYITGDGTTNFRPQDYVTRADFILMLMRAMGYDAELRTKEPYYIGSVIQKGRDLRLDKGASSGDYSEVLSRGDAYIILANAAKTEQLEMVNATEAGYSVYQEKECLLSAKYNIVLHRGIVNETKLTSLIDENKTAGKTVVVGSKTYYDAEDLLAGYLGKSVTIGVKQDDPTHIIAAWTNDDNVEVTLPAEVLVSTASDIQKGYITAYNEDGRQEKYDFSNEADVVYNGMVYSGFTADELLISTGDLRLLDNNDDDVFDVIFVNVYTVHRLMSSHLADGVLTMVDTEGKQYTFEEDYVTAKKQLGMKEAIDKLKANQVIKLYVSKDGSAATIVVCQKSEKGTLELISDDAVQLSGKSYELAAGVQDLRDSFKVKEQVTVFFDETGKIIWLQKNDQTLGTDWIIGFFQQHRTDISLSEPIQSKVFTQFNKWEVYSYAKEVELDGVTVSAGELRDIVNANANGYYAVNFMCFKLNASNEIYALDSLNNTGLEREVSMSWSIDDRVGAAMYSRASSSFWRNHSQLAKIKNESPTFIIPIQDDGNENTLNGACWTDASYDDFYQACSNIVDVTTNLNHSTYNLDLYMQDPETEFFSFAAQRREYASLATTYPVVTTPAAPSLLVEKVSNVYEDGETYIKLSGYNVLTQAETSILVERDAILVEHGLYYQDFVTQPTNGVATNYLGQQWQLNGLLLAQVLAANPGSEAKYIKKATDIGFGDIVRYQSESGKKAVTAVDRVFDYDKNQLPEQKRASWLNVGSVNVSTYLSTYYYQFAQLSGLTETTYKFYSQYVDPDSGENGKFIYLKNALTSNLLCNPEKGTITKVSDLSPYQSDSYRQMILNSGGTPRTAIVYKYER